MTTVEHLTLDGCAPTPLAAYLKGLGILRLISSDANHIDGRAADPNARGWWQDERFHLRTTLDRAGFIRFFLEDYAPSPLIAPWNGGSGFYPKDSKDGFGPLESRPVAKRFEPMARAIRESAGLIARQKMAERPEGVAKPVFVALLRAELPDDVLPWLDAALALSDNLTFPPLLGTGANDGRLDFTNNFMQRLVSVGKPPGLFDAASGAPHPDSERLLDNAVFDRAAPGLSRVAVGQFAPGAAGGANATTGYGTKGLVNPWDFVLMLEGSAAFSGAATRRHQSVGRSDASFPFTVRTVGAGWGGIDATDESNARAEFWAPLWKRPARFGEVEVLLAEGRAVLNARTAANGLEFARAVTNLGTSRGFSEFARYGFVMRAGKSFLATPMGRRAADRSPHGRLLADLDRGGWLERLRRRAAEVPAGARSAMRRFEDGLFDLATPSSSRQGVERALVALGEVCARLAVSPKWREKVSPPPPLSIAWVEAADDGSAEFRVAAALAALGLRFSQEAGASGGGLSEAPPMASHFAPVEERGFADGSRRAWTSKPNAPDLVWGAGGLVANLIGVLARRLVVTSTRGLAEKPLSGPTRAWVEDVATFLVGDFDDVRCAKLIAGLIWARPAPPALRPAVPASLLPFAYAALKPVFTPDRMLHRIGALPDGARLPVPPTLVTQLCAGRDGATRRVIGSALARARASGMPSVFDPSLAGGRKPAMDAGFHTPVPPDRLAAAMLIPVTDGGLAKLLDRAYPDAIQPTTQLA